MKRPFVLDTGIVVKWFIPEEYSFAAQRLSKTPHSLHAPDFMEIEFSNVLCKKIRQGLIDTTFADSIRDIYHQMPIQLHPWQVYIAEAYEMAKLTRRSLYDCLYLTLAVTLQGQMITADRRFYDAIINTGYAEYIYWVEDIPVG